MVPKSTFREKHSVSYGHDTMCRVLSSIPTAESDHSDVPKCREPGT